MSKKLNPSDIPPIRKDSPPGLSQSSAAPTAREERDFPDEGVSELQRLAKELEIDSKILDLERKFAKQEERLAEVSLQTNNILLMLHEIKRNQNRESKSLTDDPPRSQFDSPRSRVEDALPSAVSSRHTSFESVHVSQKTNRSVRMAADGDNPGDSSSEDNSSENRSIRNRVYPEIPDDSVDSDDVVQLTRQDRVILPQTPIAESNVPNVTKKLSDADKKKSYLSLPRLRNHRQSYLARGIIAAESASKELSVQMTRVQPSYDYIQLNDLHPKNVMRFHDQIVEFETSHRTAIFPVGFLIATDVRQEISSRSEDLFSDTTLLSLPFPDIMALLLKYTAPTTIEELWHALSTIPTFPDLKGYRPTMLNFQPWYRFILRFVNEFRRTYEFLTTALDDEEYEHIVPSCDNKEMGLIRLFCSRIPYDYGTKIVNRWKNKKFQHFHDFINAFTREIHSHFKAYKFMAQHRFLWGGTTYTSLFGDKKNVSAPVAPYRSTRTPVPNRYAIDTGQRSYPQRLHSMDVVADAIVLEGLEDEYASYNTDSPQDEVDLEPPEDLQLHDEDIFSDDVIEQETVEESFDDQLVELTNGNLHAFDPPAFQRRPAPPPPARPQENNNACYGMVMRGTCDKGPRCQFSHNPMVLKAAREALKKKLDGHTYDHRPPQHYQPQQSAARNIPVQQRQPAPVFRSDRPQPKL